MMGRGFSDWTLRAAMNAALGAAAIAGCCQTAPAMAQSVQSSEQVAPLPEVRVTARRRPAARPAPVNPVPQVAPNPAPRDVESALGPVRGYTASRSATGTKTDTPILETPQAISVVTRDQIRAQGAQTVQEALQYTPGVSLQSYGANAFFDGFKIRGFDAPSYLDGLRLPADSISFAKPKIETYGLERLEVLKGPSSGLYGQSDPGGFINMVSKRPTATPHYSVEGVFGSFNRVQGAFDIGGPIDKNGEFLYRFVGLARDSDTQIDFMQDNKLFIAPSLTWRPNNDTSFTILSQYQKIDNKGYQQYVPGEVAFLPNPNGHIPYSRYIGEPSVDGYRLEQFSVGYAFEHRFDNNLQFRQNVRYMNVTNDLASVRSEGMYFGSNSLVARSYNYVKSDSRNLAIDNQLQADFRTGLLTHKLLVGLDYLNQTGHADYRSLPSSIPVLFPGGFPPIDAYNPIYGAAVPSFSSLTPFMLHESKTNQVGLYAQDQIKLDRWTLSLTGRQDFVNTGLISKAPGVYPPQGSYHTTDSAQTGRIGLNYLFDTGLSPYASYSTSFVPNAGVSSAGEPFKPTTGEGREIGVKYMAPGTNLMLTAALFEINQNNVLTADPSNPFLNIQTDAARVRGFEFEAKGNVTRELEVAAAYTHLDPKVTRSLDGNAGKNLQAAPADQASLWAKYTWYDGPLAGFGIGAGVRYVGESYGDAANTFVIPSYALVDASVSYDLAYARPDLKGWKAQVNVTNLTDRFYVASCLTGLAYCGLGTGRTVLGTLKYSWN